MRRQTARASGPITREPGERRHRQSGCHRDRDGVGTDWKQFTFTLKTGAMEASATNHLAISGGHAGTLWLNWCRCFRPPITIVPMAIAST